MHAVGEKAVLDHGWRYTPEEGDLCGSGRYGNGCANLKKRSKSERRRKTTALMGN